MRLNKKPAIKASPQRSRVVKTTSKCFNLIKAALTVLLTAGLAISASATEISYYHTDHLGTPKAMTDETGTIVWQATHDAFGKADVTTETVTNNLRFPGQYFDEETSLHYNYFRTYDPNTGRYITSDPIGLLGGTNTYLYAGGNPLLHTDPTGLYWPGVLPENCWIVLLDIDNTYEIDVKKGIPQLLSQRIAGFNGTGRLKRFSFTVAYQKWKQTDNYNFIYKTIIDYYVSCLETNECGIEEIVNHPASGPHTFESSDSYKYTYEWAEWTKYDIDVNKKKKRRK